MNFNRIGQSFLKGFVNLADKIPAESILRNMDNADKVIRRVEIPSAKDILQNCGKEVQAQAVKLDEKIARIPGQISKMSENVVKGLQSKADQIPAEEINRALSTYFDSAKSFSEKSGKEILEDCEKKVQAKVDEFDEKIGGLPRQISKMSENTVKCLQAKTNQIPAEEINRALSTYFDSAKSFSEKLGQEICQDLGKTLVEIPSKVSDSALNVFQKTKEEIPADVVWKMMTMTPVFPYGPVIAPEKSTELARKEKLTVELKEDEKMEQAKDPLKVAPQKNALVPNALLVLPKVLQRPNVRADSTDLGVILLRSGKEIVALPRVLGRVNENGDVLNHGVISLGSGNETIPKVEKQGNGRSEGKSNINENAFIFSGLIASLSAGKMMLERAGQKPEGKKDSSVETDPEASETKPLVETGLEASETKPLVETGPEAGETKLSEHKAQTFWSGLDMQTAAKVAAVGGVAIAAVAVALLSNR